ncbi:putative integral membrane protein [Euzebya pacifica]|uniref:Putative integral membrane protein n=1 Tax=Euzebya pacifica TaxID=1608957 RepID=A0A346Y4T8_9ACTN|nr:DoxX family protein [Euzebya pacifica]AXV09485.1 putative integral membrane protein [Euzebya pacifica]
MNAALWTIQIVLGLAFLAAGAMKATKSPAELKESAGESMAWTDDLSAGQVRTIGILEVLGGLGLILPPAVDVLPILVPIAASGLVLTMLGAIVVHVRRKEYLPSVVVNLVLGGLALVVAIGRFGPQAF